MQSRISGKQSCQTILQRSRSRDKAGFHSTEVYIRNISIINFTNETLRRSISDRGAGPLMSLIFNKFSNKQTCDLVGKLIELKMNESLKVLNSCFDHEYWKRRLNLLRKSSPIFDLLDDPAHVDLVTFAELVQRFERLRIRQASRVRFEHTLKTDMKRYVFGNRFIIATLPGKTGGQKSVERIEISEINITRPADQAWFKNSGIIYMLVVHCSKFILLYITCVCKFLFL